MIEPKPWDKGRVVIFKPRHQHYLGGYKSADEFVEEEGVLIDVDKNNRDYAIIKLHSDPEPRRAKIKMLSWKD